MQQIALFLLVSALAFSQGAPTPSAGLPHSSELSLTHARQLMDQGQFDDAITELQELQANQPGLKGLSHELGLTYYKKADYIKAIESLKKALEENVRDNEAVQLLGLSYYLSGRPAEAIPLLEKVQAWYPRANVDASYILGLCYVQTKSYPQARRAFARMFDPIIQILRPVSPLAWVPLGLVLLLGAGKQASEFGALFTIAICAMWPTVLNTAVGVRAIPQDYLNVARVLQLSRAKTFTHVLLPATLPYMFTGFRLSLGIAWLVIVAAEMLTGRPGVGGFLWQEYNALIYEHIILCIITIGLVGFILDRLMSLIEKRFKTA